MHSGRSNETTEVSHTIHDFNFEDEEAMNALLPAFRKYVDSGLSLKRGNPEAEIVTLVHSLGQKTRTNPLALHISENIEIDEIGQNEGAEEIEIDEIVQSEENVEIEEIVMSNILKVVKKKQQESDEAPKKKKKHKKRKKRQKKKKVGLMDFLKDPAKAPLVPVQKENELQTPTKKKRRRRRRRKNKVVDLKQDSKMTEADLLERKRIQDKITVKKDFVMETSSRTQYEGGKGIKAWTEGAGFGSSYTQDTTAWDIATWLVGEDQRQTEIRDTLSAITQNLTDDPLLVEFLTQSCLMNVLYNYCENDSLNDIETQSKLYTEVFECLGKMLAIPAYVPLLHRKMRRFSLAQCVATLAGKFRKRLALEKLDSGEENALASLVISLSDAMNQEEEVVESQTDLANKDGDNENYCELMRELCFDSVETMADFPAHKYATTSVNMNRKLMKRLAAEYSDLGTNLPVHQESSVFFRFCEESMSHAQMLIIPPEGTPYAGGCFIFDVCFPDSYPQGPPKVNLQTTGRGAVRFNPNLYNCGKVCLSLLGTWGGQSQGEMWNPKLSSFLQVAISIQSLIFVPEPYYNEPGWEQYMGTADGDKRSRTYNKVIEKGTVDYAIVEMLENPPAAFKDVINNHFRMQAERVYSNVARWMGEDAAVTQKVEALLTDLRAQAYNTGA